MRRAHRANGELTSAKETASGEQKTNIGEAINAIGDADASLAAAKEQPDQARHKESVKLAKDNVQKAIDALNPSGLAAPGGTSLVHAPRSDLKAVWNEVNLRKPDRVIHLGAGEWQPIGVGTTVYRPKLTVPLAIAKSAPAGTVAAAPSPPPAAPEDAPAGQRGVRCRGSGLRNREGGRKRRAIACAAMRLRAIRGGRTFVRECFSAVEICNLQSLSAPFLPDPFLPIAPWTTARRSVPATMRFPPL